MIPERYRRLLPQQWYENKIAELHFEGAMSALDAHAQKRSDVEHQFFPLTATWGLDVWDWIYFGNKQLMPVDDRRKNIQRKHWGRLPFTMPVLRSLGQTVGDLISVTEDFSKKEIEFEFSLQLPIDLIMLHDMFEQMRPVHVNRERIVIRRSGHLEFKLGTYQTYESITQDCGAFYAGGENDLC
ncbi:putative phage tail protein [Brevibacillus porteri]|uniref:putative phage tail protein n=1 Tax=Brevibacillus porteri TaxID=2126350 RepID=UPI003D1DEA1F